jgi:hypothetical protein
MKTAEKRNLDLIFEFEKYVLEHPEITEKIPSRRYRIYESGRGRKVQSLE